MKKAPPFFFKCGEKTFSQQISICHGVFRTWEGGEFGPVGSVDTRIAYPQQFKDGYPAGTNTALRVRYRSLLHRFPQM